MFEKFEKYPIYTLKPSEFPSLLREINDPPDLLYIRGALPNPEHKFLSIVGSRKYSSYGKEVCEELIDGLRGYPITIVSGLALGMDGLAHKAALLQDCRLSPCQALVLKKSAIPT